MGRKIKRGDYGVFSDHRLKPLIDAIKEITGGSLPISHLSTDREDCGKVFVHEPSGHPQILIWENEGDCWIDVGIGLARVLRYLQGIPSLRAVSEGKYVGIAQDIYGLVSIWSEWQILKNFKIDAGQPKLANETESLESIEKFNEETDPKYLIFTSLKYLLLENLGSDVGRKIFSDLENKFPDKALCTKTIFSEVSQFDVATVLGTIKFTASILKALEFPLEEFCWEVSEFGVQGKARIGIDYIIKREERRERFYKELSGKRTEIKVKLPIEIPIGEGIYRVDNCLILLEKSSYTSKSKNWNSFGNVGFSATHSQVGTYQNAEVTIVLPVAHNPERLSGEFKSFEVYKHYSKAFLLATEVLNEFIFWVREEKSRFDTPNINILNFDTVSIDVYNSNSDKIFSYPLLSHGGEKIHFGHIYEVKDKIFIQKILEVPYYKKLIGLSKKYLIETDSRNAILYFCTGYEAFCDDYLISHVGEHSETTRQRFLRLYSDQIDKKSLENITDKLIDSDEDFLQKPSIYKITKLYKNLKLNSKLNSQNMKKILKPFKFRNDAAHGRPVPTDALDIVVNAITAFEEIEEIELENLH